MFYDEYRKLCKSRGKSPSAVAREIGISPAAVSDWKSKGYTPSARTLQKIADYFGVAINTFFEIKDAPALSEGAVDNEISKLFNSLSADRQDQALAFLRFLAASDTQEK